MVKDSMNNKYLGQPFLSLGHKKKLTINQTKHNKIKHLIILHIQGNYQTTYFITIRLDIYIFVTKTYFVWT